MSGYSILDGVFRSTSIVSVVPSAAEPRKMFRGRAGRYGVILSVSNTPNLRASRIVAVQSYCANLLLQACVQNRRLAGQAQKRGSCAHGLHTPPLYSVFQSVFPSPDGMKYTHDANAHSDSNGQLSRLDDIRQARAGKY